MGCVKRQAGHDGQSSLTVFTIKKIKQIADFLQYNLLCDVIDYKEADNFKIINRKMLSIFLKRKLSYTKYSINKIINNLNELF